MIPRIQRTWGVQGKKCSKEKKKEKKNCKYSQIYEYSEEM
jgi:hypothetical protein